MPERRHTPPASPRRPAAPHAGEPRTGKPTSARPRYHVVACSMPIVYTQEGDHDPNGMAYVLKPVRVLLDKAKALWNENDRLLPKLHERRQRAQIVIDGLPVLEAMLERLRSSGGVEDGRLLAELEHAERVPEGEAEPPAERDAEPTTPRDKARRQNVHHQVATLLGALKLLEAHGTPFAPVEPPDPPEPSPTPAAPPRDPAAVRARWQAQQRADKALAIEKAFGVKEGGGDDEPAEDEAPEAGSIRLVTLEPAQRAALRAHWVAQKDLLDRAIEGRLQAQNAALDLDVLASTSGIPRPWVERLLLNDHAPASRHRPCDRFNPLRPIPALRPLVLRCRQGDRVDITFENSMGRREVGFHVQGDGLSAAGGSEGRHARPAGRGVAHADGAAIGRNHDSTCPPGGRMELRYDAAHQGVWPINDLADVRGGEDGTNAHGLFGAIVVEPAGCDWHDPVTGCVLTNEPWCSLLDVDIHVAGENTADPRHRPYVDLHCDDVPRSFREFTVFIHDEPEVHSGLHVVGEHAVMPLSYRAEPMHNRLPCRMHRYAEATAARTPTDPEPDVDRRAVTWDVGNDELDLRFFTARNNRGDWLERVAGEEQHHSSWLFGDPVTHIQRAYAGDPCRVRLVHAGVKETHVYHLHVHQWRAVAADTAQPSVHGTGPDGLPRPKGSQLLDSVTIGPQSATTIEPLYGSGSRQHAIGDIIWHCHLYPHFHHGMWGLWRSYSHLVDGSRAYPDGSHCTALQPLPGRAPPTPTPQQPGFPWFIDGVFPMKSPPPPVVDNVPLNGRRVLLRMPRASQLEYAAMPPSCRAGEQPGAVFVDLDGQARGWYASAGLPEHPRIVSYDVDVVADNVDYNERGWHDPRGHFYRLKKVHLREWVDGSYRTTHVETFESTEHANPSPFFPRANQGDIVEWRQNNQLTSFAADAFDLGQFPVEVGLHVHLVKFDPLASDGSATGWNYLSGSSCLEAVGNDGPGERRTVSLHRWVVDEEFGPCFFHDHLLANYRQKHGLFAALITQPHGSSWVRADDQGRIAWSDPQAVVVPPPSSGLPPYREACLGICDFVALLDEDDRALNPPGKLSGDDDPGSMAVNYRSAPLTFRGRDPSQWFASSSPDHADPMRLHGDPGTPIVKTYPGERLRIRLVQGSHEEQHGFALHGMRWRRDWGNPRSTFVNQQTLGISEAFTFDIDPQRGESPYGPGDHLYHFCAMDDVWLGCWGLVRALDPIASNFAHHAPLPDLGQATDAAMRASHAARAVGDHPSRDDPGVRTFVVVAERCEHRFAGTAWTDPWGLIYRVVEYADRQAIDEALHLAAEQRRWPLADADERKHVNEPLVLRARRGEWVRVILVNNLFDGDASDASDDDGRDQVAFGVETSAARLPLESVDDQFRPNQRTVSTRVSIHPSLLRYDVRQNDGSHVGSNPDTTVGAMRGNERHGLHGGEAAGAVIHRLDHDHGHDQVNWREIWWYADDKLAPQSHAEGPGQVCYLHDMADLRNHRHHGLIGALVVEPGDVTPFVPGSDVQAWHGVDAEIRTTSDGRAVACETVVFVQDGLRFYVNGHPDFPVPDADPKDDPEDSGQKAVNYRSQPVHRGRVSRMETDTMPLMEVPKGSTLWLRIVGANDKPRQHTMTVHGCSWPAAPWVTGSDRIGALTGLSPCRAETVVVHLPHAGDHAVRAGGFRWSAEHGVWASVRVRDEGA